MINIEIDRIVIGVGISWTNTKKSPPQSIIRLNIEYSSNVNSVRIIDLPLSQSVCEYYDKIM